MKKSFLNTKKILQLPNWQKSDEELTVKDCITVVYDTSSKLRSIILPTFISCNSCGAYNGFVTSGNRIIKRPDLLRDLLYIQYGLNLKNYDVDPPTAACSCRQDLSAIQRKIANFPLLDEQGWVGSPGGRAVVNYTKQVKFSRNLFEDELKVFIQYLTLNNCPGWTGVSYRKLNDGLYLFSTTNDSSD